MSIEFDSSMWHLQILTTTKKEEKAGIVIGNKKILTLGYADDIVLIAEEEKAMKKMEKYIERRGLSLILASQY